MLELALLTLAAVMVTLISLKPALPKRPAFTTVKKIEPNELDGSQRYIYDTLMDRGYYVTCGIKEKNVSLPLALVPFRIALIERKHGFMKNLTVSLYLNIKGWETIFYSDSINDQDMSVILEKIKVHDFNDEREMKKVQ
ncbi:hypothetical protein K8O68_13615 [Salipaludibacillus sp. CUR1]|uniref:hypothetical protein n=1 Tax=Salipaludibacillus sp. CUR1 TaxID=2820003 RepID=UPI001E3B0532|nr:hypothetical protein [Salipaludibacillus sp. CUR1]MCE7793458.1 hypothetical protein [Salipaludibacillus sp. CUR1]